MFGWVREAGMRARRTLYMPRNVAMKSPKPGVIGFEPYDYVAEGRHCYRVSAHYIDTGVRGCRF